MKTVIIAEKPSVGKDIARVLGCRNGGSGFLESAQYVVTWALGHLVTLAEPEDYDKKYKNWDIDHLPIMPQKLQLVVIPQTSKQFRAVRDILHRKDVSGIIIATDAGREGELVARWIIEKAGCNKPIKRLWISSVTDKAIREGFAGLKDGKLYKDLCDSAKARAEADWLVGINATRCLTTKFNSPLSAGRVQTPTVSIIVKREEEIRRFVPQAFYGLAADAGTFAMNWSDKGGSARCFEKERIDGILKQLQGQREATVIGVDKTVKKKYPPKLYDLTELQRDASKRFGYSPKETLALMQKLYEEHKALTYPRTDSRYISSDIVPTLNDRVKACSAKQHSRISAQILRGPIRANANFVDDARLSDHHAIIPTEQAVSAVSLSDREWRVYDLVVTRFLSVFYPPFEYEQTAVRFKIGHEVFTASGKVVLSQGFKEVYKGGDTDDEEDEAPPQTLPKFKNGDKINIRGIKLTEGKTSPPPPFNDASLLSAMENPAKYMDTKDKALAETLEKTGGLGTVATRADIIEKLFDNFLIEKKGKEIFSTSKGRQLLALVPKDLKSPELTGLWEQKLSAISKGKLGKEAFIQEIRQYTAAIIKEIKASSETFKHDNMTRDKCPGCGKFMLIVKGKKGEMLVCQDRECNTRVNLSFSERRREKSDGMNKRELQAFLENQNKRKSGDKDSPFAALKDMKFDK